MKILLVLVVCSLSLIDLTAAAECYTNTDLAITVGTSVKATIAGTEKCREVVTYATTTGALTTITVARSKEATCTATADLATVETGAALTFTTCCDPAGTDLCNKNNYQGTTLGCYSCTDATLTGTVCSDPSATANAATAVKFFDKTAMQTAKSCKAVFTYTAGKLTKVERSRVDTTACTAENSASLSLTADGTQTTCCSDKTYCNSVVPATTQAPATTTMAPTTAKVVPKHATKNIINAFVLMCAVIVAIVSK